MEKRRSVLSSTADMWHRVARLEPRQGQEMRIGLPKQALPAPDQAVGKGWLLLSGKHTGCLGKKHGC